MATLVFSAVGTMVAGPIGGAVGSLVGSQVDAALFGPSGRQGARLKELEVTTSSYGQPIARHFGRMRVAGQMIWATDLVEHSEVLGGGKGSPAVTNYSYSASFAVALASRPILGVGRIWADGKLLRGEAGDLKAAGTLRIHIGQGDQAPDPLMLAAEGPHCPAHRDLAYVVFEDLDLSGFYNHIPALTFEVIADESFGLAAIVENVVEDVDAAVALESIVGLTNEGPLSETISLLDQVYPLDIDSDGERIVIARSRLQAAPVALGDAATAVDDDEFAAASGFARYRAPADEQPFSALRYYDSARDYLPGMQFAAGRPSPGEPRIIELPAVLAAADARALIEQTARRLDWSRDTIAWRSSELAPGIAPGSLVTVPEIAGTWRVREWEWRSSGIAITAERSIPVGAEALPVLPADPGQIHPQPDLPVATTLLAAFELPYDSTSGTPGKARPFAAVSSAQANWSGAALYAESEDGQLHPLGPSGRSRSPMGRTTSALGPANPLLFDRASRLTVALADTAMPLTSASARQLAEGANLALVGNELIQFAQATRLPDGTWLLEGLLRGRGGSENGIASHDIDEPFIVIDGRVLAIDPGLIGTSAAHDIVAIGRGDSVEVRSAIALSGLTLRPLAPVHPRKTVLADGTWRIAWTRRARGNLPWRDGVEVPLVEEAENYLITFGPAEAPMAVWSASSPQIDLAPDVRRQLAAKSPGQWLRVAQQGSYAISPGLDLCPLE